MQCQKHNLDKWALIYKEKKKRPGRKKRKKKKRKIIMMMIYGRNQINKSNLKASEN